MYTIYYIYYNEILIYVGSTIDLNKRKGYHKSRCYNKNSKEYNKKLYEYIRANDIIFENLVWKTEETNITDTTEARKYEGSKILELNPLCNCVIAGRGQKESNKQWRENNREKNLERHKQWREYNQEQILEYQRQWYEKNKEKILERQRLKRLEKKE